MPLDVRVARVYDEPAANGTRVLVDRLWPRGLRKDAARLDAWAKDVAPSSELRTWYGHDPALFDEFRRRYLAELAGTTQQAALGQLRALASAPGPLIAIPFFRSSAEIGRASPTFFKRTAPSSAILSAIAASPFFVPSSGGPIVGPSKSGALPLRSEPIPPGFAQFVFVLSQPRKPNRSS